RDFESRALGPAEIGAEIEEIVLDARQRRAHAVVCDMQQGDADYGVRLIDAAISFDAGVEFRQTRAIAERRASVIAGARVDAIEFHDVESSVRPGGLPVFAATTLSAVARGRNSLRAAHVSRFVTSSTYFS